MCYYPSAELDYSLLNRDLKYRCNYRGISDDYINYSFLTDILAEIRDFYYLSIKDLIIKDNKGKDKYEQITSTKPIPIGMLSSNIIANWYLRTFDELINQFVKPSFYGRYVDDILIVLENHCDCEELSKEDGICDKNCCIEKRKLTIHKVLKQYFCGCNKNGCASKILGEEEVIQDRDNIGNKKFNYYITVNNNRLKIQGDRSANAPATH